MQIALRRLHRDGFLEEDPAVVAPFEERQRLVDKALYDALEAKYSTAG
jgi:hypothetical protein